MESGRGTPLLLAVPEPSKTGSWAELLGPCGVMGQPQGPWMGRLHCSQPLPLPAPQGAALPTPLPQAGVLEMSCPGWGMPQVTVGPSLQPQRGLWTWLLVGPEPVPASCPQPCQLPARQSWGAPRGRGCAAGQLSAAPVPPPQPAVPLTESRDSHNYLDYKERVIDLQPALCDQRPGSPPGPPLLL